MMPYLWLILIPAVLLVLGVQYFFTGRLEPEKRVRFFLVLLLVIAVMNGAIGGLSRLIDSAQSMFVEPGSSLCGPLGASCETVRELMNAFAWLVNSAFLLQVAFVAALFMFWPGRSGWTPRRIVLALGLAALALLAGAFASQSLIYFVIAIFLTGGLVILVWRAWAWGGVLRYIAFAVLAFLLGLVIWYELDPAFVWNRQTSNVFTPSFFILGIWPALAASLAARLFYSAITPRDRVSSQAPAMENPDGPGSIGEGVHTDQAARPASPRPAWASLAFRLVFIAAALLLFWQLDRELAREGMWDQMEDGLSTVFIQQSVISAGLAGSVLMAWSLAGWRKLGALVFAALVLFDMTWAIENSMKTDPAQFTEAGAARIEKALQAYRTRTGGYPQDLTQLVPFYLLSLPQPVMERGESWCYQAGQEYYRLGYVWKPGFGPPPEMLKVRIPASAGQPPEGTWECDEDLARLKQHYTKFWKDVESQNP